jgi:hypothetical protein
MFINSDTKMQAADIQNTIHISSSSGQNANQKFKQ